MSPSPRVAAALVALAAAALVVPVPLVLLGALVLATATVVDAAAARRPPPVARSVPSVLARGVPAPLVVRVDRPGARIRQPAPPDLRVHPPEGDDRLDAVVVPQRRGRHTLPAPATRSTGPLGLGRWDHQGGPGQEVLVYPDLPAARRLALAVRRGTLRGQGLLTRGPLGLGTDFESVRDYVPDDDVRQINWRATARMARPMSNQYRLDEDRDVVCLVDGGRLMAAPLDPPGGAGRTRLDAALDAVAAVALVADEVGDRCGALAFDAEVRRRLAPRRRGAAAVVESLFDLEPRPLDSDYELAFRTVGRSKRALVLVLTDLVEEGAVRPLLDAVPVLARQHALVVASVADPDLDGLVRTAPATPLDAYAASVAVEVLEARTAVAHQLTRAGADVVEAPPDGLGRACVAAYLRMKRRARL